MGAEEAEELRMTIPQANRRQKSKGKRLETESDKWGSGIAEMKKMMNLKMEVKRNEMLEKLQHSIARKFDEFNWRVSLLEQKNEDHRLEKRAQHKTPTYKE
ncbi:hypothetical protein BGX38DRAFT_1142874 [Terfezia claveryi]|nr:hypothetical protein BGX38DRAFT_1142874 [Terfezia claveryi]